MNFYYPVFLWLALLTTIGLVAFNVWSARKRRELIARFVHTRLLESLTVGVSSRLRKLKNGLILSAVALTLIALARPQWGRSEEKVLQRGIDVVIAIDTSRSQLAEDIEPNRFERTKLAVQDLVEQSRGVRFALAPFAGSAFLQSPLTLDRGAFLEILKSVQIGDIPQGGSALAEAIRVSSAAFDEESANHKVVVLFSDGEDHLGGAARAARIAAESGIRVFTVGVGTPEGEILRVKAPDGRLEIIKDRMNSPVRSQLNETGLKEIAEQANGFYVSLQGADSMQALYEGGIDSLPKSDVEADTITRRKERFQWPLGIAALLLILERFVPERAGERSRRFPWNRTPTDQALAGLIALLIMSPNATAAVNPKKGEALYQEEKFGAARTVFEELIEKGNTDPRVAFNAAAAAYKQGDLDAALDRFDQATLAEDLNLQQKAYYGLANTLYRSGEIEPTPEAKMEKWKTALERYKSALSLNPDDGLARHNHDFVKKQLDELERQQQSQGQEGENSEDSEENNDESESSENQEGENQDEQNGDQENSESQDSESQDQEGSEGEDPEQEGEERQQSEEERQDGSEGEDESEPESEMSEEEQQDESQPDSGEKQDSESSGSQSNAPQETPLGEMTEEQVQELLNQFRAMESILPMTPRNPKNPNNSRDWKDW